MRAINRKPMKLLALKFDLPLPIIIKLDNKISREWYNRSTVERCIGIFENSMALADVLIKCMSALVIRFNLAIARLIARYLATSASVFRNEAPMEKHRVRLVDYDQLDFNAVHYSA